MVKYVVSSMLEYVIIIPVDESEISDENGNIKDAYRDDFICDTFEQAEEIHNLMLEEQHCWLLIRSILNKTVRVVEYIDGPRKDYFEDSEFIGGCYICRHAAEEDEKFFRNAISCYYIVGNTNTGELHEMFYTGGPVEAYIGDDEVIIGKSATKSDDASELYSEHKEWTEKWEKFYNLKFV